MFQGKTKKRRKREKKKDEQEKKKDINDTLLSRERKKINRNKQEKIFD